MSFEYLIVGIAKGQEEDYREFYDKTKVEAYMFALSIVKDRVLARDIAVEAYKRIYSLAYKFDTDLNAEYWLLDIVKNLSVNSLKHSDLRKMADANRSDTLTRLLSDLIFNTAEDRAKFVVLRTVSGLKKSEISRLLWYKGGSASAEYSRGLKELVNMDEDNRSSKDITEELKEDMTSCTPDMWGLVVKEEDTKVSFVSHAELNIDDEEVEFTEENEELIQIKRAADRKKRKIKIFAAVIVVILLCAVIASIIVAVVSSGDGPNSAPDDKKPDQVFDIILPQQGTSIAMAELDGVLYFQNYADGEKLYKADFSTGKAVLTKISDDIPKDIVVSDSVGKYVIYRTIKGIYRYSPADGATELLYKNVGAMCVNADTLYFNVSGEGILSMEISKGAESCKTVWAEPIKANEFNNPTRYDIEADVDSKIYFSAGPMANGVFSVFEKLNESTGEVEIYTDNISFTGDQKFAAGNHIYDMCFVDGCLYFDLAHDGINGLYKVDTKSENKATHFENVYLSSAAIDVRDGYIYYAGYVEDPEVNKDAERGLFRVSVEGGTPEMLGSQNDTSLHISDIFVSKGKIYVYSCTPDENGAKKLVAYTTAGLNKDNFAEKSVSIF